MKKTRLNVSHHKLNAKMIEFFGWEMPLEYTSIVSEHIAVRKRVGIFDVSHMGEIQVSGRQALDYIQYLTPNNASRVNTEKAQYTCLTTPQGTFVDDMLVYCLSEGNYLLVVNAANVEKDYAWVSSHAKDFDVSVRNLSDEYTQIALQGPHAFNTFKDLTDVNVEDMKSFGVSYGHVAGEEAMVSRTGYTGEDGFEIYTLSNYPDKIWEAILEQGRGYNIQPVGLGARDTLRLEATLMLYGNDIDDTTTVLEAGLSWLVKFKKGDFLGRDVLLQQREEGLKRKLVGFELIDKGIARPHYPVILNGKKVSEVTSGTFTPHLKKSIGLTYLPIEYTAEGVQFQIEIRGKQVTAQVVSLPFYKRAQS